MEHKIGPNEVQQSVKKMIVSDFIGWSVGPDHTWAKENLKTITSANDWEAKKAIVERFALSNQELRHQEKLSELKFDPRESTLTSYVEDFADTYKKAYKQAKDREIIQGLNLNLPNDILRNLDILSETRARLISAMNNITKQ